MNPQKIVIVRYNGGNIQSVDDALRRLGTQALVTDDADEILTADKVIFPGVGEAKSAMAYLKERELDKVLKSIHQPFLGICLGQQLMCSHSEEGDTECLGIFEEKVKKFQSKDSGLKIPHMGWNSVYDLKGDLYNGVQDNSYVYFVHSYFVEVGNDTVATCNYIHPFTASLQRDNYYSCQFHPEKSAGIGSQVLKNFIGL